MVFQHHHVSISSSTSFSLLNCRGPEDFIAVFVVSVFSFLETILIELKEDVNIVSLSNIKLNVLIS